MATVPVTKYLSFSLFIEFINLFTIKNNMVYIMNILSVKKKRDFKNSQYNVLLC